jgi:hypothetical protein
MQITTTMLHRIAHDEYNRANAAPGAFGTAAQLLSGLSVLPSVTPTELREKLATLRARGCITATNIHNGPVPAILDRIDADLASMARPNPAPAMVELFEKWKRSWLAFHHAAPMGDREADAASDAEMTEWQALMMAPCTTPGDFILKRFVDLASDDSTYRNASPTLLNPSAPHNGGTKDAIALASAIADLDGCDLGRCLQALGRADFDAMAWLENARAIGATVTVMIEADGKRALWQRVDLEDGATEAQRRHHKLLTALLGGDTWQERTSAVIEAIVEHFPEQVADLREMLPDIADALGATITAE